MIEALLLGAVVGVVYTFAGYPLLLRLAAKLVPRPHRRAAPPVATDVTVIIVAYNEAARIARKIDNCLQQQYAPGCLRVVVASDGSTDGTADIVRRTPAVMLLDFATRRGKAACLNDAIGASTTEIVVLTDVRQRLASDAVAMLVQNFADSAVGAASGELMFEDAATDEEGFGAGVDAYWRYEKFIRRNEALVHSVVGATGALYAIRRREFKPIPADTILDDVLIPMNIVLRGKRVVFDERAHAFDRPSQRVGQERARKVRTLAGNFQLITQHPQLLWPWRNPVAIQLVSHKVLRLFAPYALLLLLACNVWIVAAGAPAPYWLLLAAQLAAYGAAAVGIAWPRATRFRPVRLASAFVWLNAFAVAGLWHFLRHRNAHLWSAAALSRSH